MEQARREHDMTEAWRNLVAEETAKQQREQAETETDETEAADADSSE